MRKDDYRLLIHINLGYDEINPENESDRSYLSNFSKKIDIQLEIDVESADGFIESVKDLSAGSAQIIIED